MEKKELTTMPSQRAHELGQKHWVGVRDLQRRLKGKFLGLNLQVVYRQMSGKTKVGHNLHVNLGKESLARLPLVAAPEGSTQHATVKPKIFLAQQAVFEKNNLATSRFKQALIAAIKESNESRIRGEI